VVELAAAAELVRVQFMDLLVEPVYRVELLRFQMELHN
jgi:hypothetical protein